MITYLNEGEELSQKLRKNLMDKDRSYYNTYNDGKLRMHQIPDLTIEIADIDQYSNEVYALLRKNGLGTSDSSALLGVNPYTSRAELIAEKARNYLTEEEKGIGNLVPVRKGRDLESLIIHKHEKIMGGIKIIKPTDMYGHKKFPYLKFNFDGVIDDPKQYIPDEIKVVTMYGEKHYNFTKAWFNESTGFGLIPDDISDRNWSIETKAGYYGIPPYYYTQLQQQILGLNAPYGYLTVLSDKTWEIHSFYVWRDQTVCNALITEGYKVWEQIKERRGPEWTLNIPTTEAGMVLTSTEPSQNMTAGSDPNSSGNQSL